MKDSQVTCGVVAGSLNRLVRAKSCHGCRAYEYNAAGMGKYGGELDFKCSLNYAQVKGVPCEPCPKPKTVGAFVAELQARRERIGPNDRTHRSAPL